LTLITLLRPEGPPPATAELVADGSITLSGSAYLTELILPLEASGYVSLSGAAWLSLRAPGEDTMQAHGYIHTGIRARLTVDTDPALPETDDLGWTTPDVTVPDIRGLSIRASGVSFRRAQVSDLTIELDTEGGPKSASLTVDCALDRHPRIGRDTLIVTYKARTLFRGRLESIATDVTSSSGYTLTYAGPLVALRDHKAFRTVFVDSDLQNWQTDQGPRTSPDTFEVASRSTGAAV